MIGPCLCGDIYCQSCFPGNDGGALEAAEEWMMETLAKAKLTPDEYRVVVSVGLAAVHHARKAAKLTADVMRQNQAEHEAYLREKEDWKNRPSLP